MADRETDPDEAPADKSFGDPVALKRPSKAQIAAAVDRTPTVEDPRSPEIPVPSYLEHDRGRLSGTVAKDGARPGFTDAVSRDPTEAEPLPRPRPDQAPGSAPGASKRLALISVGLAVVAIAVVVLLLR